MKSLGVDIGKSSIKVIEAESSGRGLSINQFWEMALSTDPTKDQALEIIEKLRAFSSHYLAAHPAGDTKWVIAVPQALMSVRLKRFPFRERQKILKSLPFELEEDVPFNMAETIFDGRTIEMFPNGADVLAVACPHEAIQTAISQAHDGGLEPGLVTAEGFALSNILDNWSAVPPQNPGSATLGDDTVRTNEMQPAHAVLQIGHSHSLLIVYRQSKPVAIRSIPWGGMDACLGIEATFKVPHIEAIKVLQTKSFVLLNTSGATRDQLAMHKAISDSTASLLRELRLSLLDVKTTAGANILEIFLTGSASQIQNFAPWLTQAIEVPVNQLNYFNALAGSGRVILRIDTDPKVENAAGTAIGLAIEGLRKPKNPAINLRRGPFAQTNETVRQFLMTWKPTAQIAISIFVLFLAYAVFREQMTLNLAAVSDEALTVAAKTAANLKGPQATADGISKYIRSEMREIKNRTTLAQLDSYIPALDILLQMSERLPVQLPPKEGRGLDVDHLSISNDDVVIEGRAQGADLLASLEKELQSMARSGTLHKTTPTGVRQGMPGTTFGYSFKVNRKP